MIRWNWRTSAGSRLDERPSSVAMEPLMDVSGTRSSWLTIARNSARSRSASSSGVRSWSVTTTDSTSSSSERIGVALSSTVTLRPSGTPMTISSARTVSPVPSACASGNSSSEISRPSARRKLSTSSSSSTDWSGLRRPSTILLASRLSDTTSPVFAAKTTTPTGEVLTRASRPALARRSSRCWRARAMAVAAWDANSTRVSSSSAVNSAPPPLSDR